MKPLSLFAALLAAAGQPLFPATAVAADVPPAPSAPPVAPAPPSAPAAAAAPAGNAELEAQLEAAPTQAGGGGARGRAAVRRR